MSEISDQEFELINQSTTISLQNSTINSTINSDDDHSDTEMEQNLELSSEEKRIKKLTQAWINQTDDDKYSKKLLGEISLKISQMITLLETKPYFHFPEKDKIFLELFQTSSFKSSYSSLMKLIFKYHSSYQVDLNLLLKITTEVLKKYPQTIMIPLDDPISLKYHNDPEKYSRYIQIRSVIYENFDHELKDLAEKDMKSFITAEVIRMICQKINLDSYKKNIKSLVQLFSRSNHLNLMDDKNFHDLILEKLDVNSESFKYIYPQDFYQHYCPKCNIILEYIKPLVQVFSLSCTSPIEIDSKSFQYHSDPEKYSQYIQIRSIIYKNCDSELKDLIGKDVKNFITTEVIRMICQRINLIFYQKNIDSLVQLIIPDRFNILDNKNFHDLILGKLDYNSESFKPFKHKPQLSKSYHLVKYIKPLNKCGLLANGSPLRNNFEYLQFIEYSTQFSFDNMNFTGMIKLLNEMGLDSILVSDNIVDPYALENEKKYREARIIKMILKIPIFDSENLWLLTEDDYQIIKWARKYLQIGNIKFCQSEISWTKYNPEIVNYLKMPITDKITDWTSQKWEEFRGSKYYDNWFIGNSLLTGCSLAYIAYLKMKD